MNAKTEQQIQRMKQQTIGVEIEMNHITRERAARLAAAYFGTDRCEYTASRNGYSTWSAWDAQGREWKFQRDNSISGIDTEKCELVTPILTYADIERLQELVRRLRKAGAKSRSHQPRRRRGWGTHSHWSKRTHTAKPAKPCQHHGKPRAVACGCPAPRPEPDASLLPNRQPEFHRTAEPKKAHHHGTACGHLVYHKRGGIRQNAPLQRQPLSHDQLPRPFHERDD